MAAATETGRIAGAKVQGKTGDDLADLSEQLARKVIETIQARSDELVVSSAAPQDRIAKINNALGDKPRPSVWIDVAERHVGEGTMDPAAETELARLLEATGFAVIDPQHGNRKDADIILEGEAFSEFAARHHDLISVKARVEIKAIDRATGERVATDRQTEIAVDLAEQVAGKAALQNAAAQIATRILPKLGKKR